MGRSALCAGRTDAIGVRSPDAAVARGSMVRPTHSMNLSSVRVRIATVIALAVFGAVYLALHAPIPQSPEYHRFADDRTFFGAPRALDVLSNLPFLVVGALGLWRTSRWSARLLDPRERYAWLGFFAGVLLTAFGSGYYHQAPANGPLVWDRLPMTIGFMSLFAAQLGERIDPRIARGGLVPLLLCGFASVIYWDVTEAAGRGDLRPYYFVQGFPIAALLVMLLARFPARYDGSRWLWGTIGFYVLAKVLEANDWPIFEWSHHVVSGHTVKHLAAAAATAMIYPMLMRRRALAAAEPSPVA